MNIRLSLGRTVCMHRIADEDGERDSLDDDDATQKASTGVHMPSGIYTYFIPTIV